MDEENHVECVNIISINYGIEIHDDEPEIEGVNPSIPIAKKIKIEVLGIPLIESKLYSFYNNCYDFCELVKFILCILILIGMFAGVIGFFVWSILFC